MLEYSFFALGYSLLPFLVFAAGFGEVASWRASSALAFAAYVGCFLANRRFLREFAALASGRERFAASLVDFPAALLLALNAALLPFESGALLYLAAVYLHLSGAAVGSFGLSRSSGAHRMRGRRVTRRPERATASPRPSRGGRRGSSAEKTCLAPSRELSEARDITRRASRRAPILSRRAGRSNSCGPRRARSCRELGSGSDPRWCLASAAGLRRAREARALPLKPMRWTADEHRAFCRGQELRAFRLPTGSEGQTGRAQASAAPTTMLTSTLLPPIR